MLMVEKALYYEAGMTAIECFSLPFGELSPASLVQHEIFLFVG